MTTPTQDPSQTAHERRCEYCRRPLLNHTGEDLAECYADERLADELVHINDDLSVERYRGWVIFYEREFVVWAWTARSANVSVTGSGIRTYNTMAAARHVARARLARLIDEVRA